MKKTLRTLLLSISAGTILCAAMPALSQDAQDTDAAEETTELQSHAHTYSPEGCDFEITFPQEPYNTRKCHPDFKDQCDIMSSFTKVYDMESTLSFYVTCNPTAEGEYHQYNQDILRTMLIARAGNRLKTKETAYKEQDGIKMSSIIGAGQSPAHKNNVILYISQVWISQNSLMTVEGELIGDASPRADSDFADILRSLRVADKSEKTETGTEENKETEDKE